MGLFFFFFFFVLVFGGGGSGGVWIGLVVGEWKFYSKGLKEER